ncbi:hypothetical protein D3C75_1253120 [compost metagenome]
MFRSKHPTVFACPVGQVVTVLLIGTAIIHTQFQRTARVQLKASQTQVEGIVDGWTLVTLIVDIA